MPVIETGTGNCHVYVDATADFQMALDIIYNAKTQRIGVCNACESLLVHQSIAEEFLPLLKERLDEKQVEIRADEASCRLVPGFVPAAEEDWGAGVPGLHPLLKAGGKPGGGHRPHQPLRHRPLGGHRHQGLRECPEIPGGGGRGGGVRQRLHPASPTGPSSASGRRSVSAPRSSTPGGPWDCGS